ncbi:MAG: hypothetical protein K9J42_00420, partial [Sulfuritalea sp.]|nr:hypothetical protein [Sulfuritalea sp.]
APSFSCRLTSAEFFVPSHQRRVFRAVSPAPSFSCRLTSAEFFVPDALRRARRRQAVASRPVHRKTRTTP